MSLLPHERKITNFVVASFILQPVLAISSFIFYPPDLSKEFPFYHPNGIMLLNYGGALFIAGLTVLGIKLADEKKVLASAGFTMLAISGAILMASMFEISDIVSMETYEKFYRIQASSDFLYLPAMYLISDYSDFKKWIRYIGLVSSIPLLISGFMFFFGYRNFQTLENISNVGFGLMFITSFSWAYNIHINYKRRSSHTVRDL